MQPSLASLIVAVFKRNSVEYTWRISSLSATRFTIKRSDFERFATTDRNCLKCNFSQTLREISLSEKHILENLTSDATNIKQFEINKKHKRKNRNVVYCGLYSYRQRVHVIAVFPNIFSYCFCILSEFPKVFEEKVWRVQAAHLHNAARALSSPSRCFNCQQILAKNSFVIFDIVVKNKSNVV